MQELFNFACMVQLSLMTPNLAINFYAFMKGKPEDQYHYYFLLEVVFVIFQFLFYCWFGTELTSRVITFEKNCLFHFKQCF